MPVGTIAPLGYARETTPGTPVAAATWIPYMDGAGDTDIALQYPELITNSRQVNRFSLLGPQKTRGNAKYNLFADQGLDLIIGALAVPTGSSPHWAGTYIPTAGLLPSFTLEFQKGSVQTYRLVGAQVDKLKVSIKAGSQVEIDLDFFALDYVTLGSPGTPAYTATDPFNFSGTTVTLGAVGAGATDTDVTEVEFTLDNHLIEQWTLQAATAAPRRTDAAKTTVSGKLTKYFADATLYTAYRARTQQILSLSWTNGSNTITFTIPRFNITKHSVPIKLGDFIVQEFEFTGVVDATVGGIIQLVTT